MACVGGAIVGLILLMLFLGACWEPIEKLNELMDHKNTMGLFRKFSKNTKIQKYIYIYFYKSTLELSQKTSQNWPIFILELKVFIKVKPIGLRIICQKN
jgi:hypothetical protein